MESNEILTLPEVQEVRTETEQVAALADGFAVTTPAQYTAAGEELTRIKAAQKRLDETRKSLTRPLDESKKRIMDLFKPMAERLAQAEMVIKRAAVAFQQEQERIRREEQRKAEEAARKERERLAARAAKAAEAGKAEKAAELAMQAETVTAPVVHREPPKVEGISTRQVWKFRITDPSKLPREYLTPDEKKIGGVVRALKGDTSIPGVEVYAEDSIAARAASF